MKRRLPRVLSMAEVREMLRFADPKEYIIIYTVSFLGLRSNELRTMRIENIDFVNNQVKVLGKGNKERLIPIPLELKDTLSKYILGRTNGYLIHGKSRQGTISNTHIRRLVKGVAVRSGIRKPTDIHPHTLRHTYATYVYDETDNLVAVKELLGHSDISTTQIYIHTSQKKLGETVRKAFRDGANGE